jgi:hypothetical protein
LWNPLRYFPVETLYAKAERRAQYWPAAAVDQRRCLCFGYCRAETAISSQWMSASVQFRRESKMRSFPFFSFEKSFDIFYPMFFTTTNRSLALAEIFMNDCQEKLFFAPSTLFLSVLRVGGL